MSSFDYCSGVLESLRLRGIMNNLDEAVNEATTNKVSHLDFLKSLLVSEVNYRNEKRLQRNLAAAHFPVVKDLESFDFSRIIGISGEQINNLQDFRWIDQHENIMFFGPPGLGKTHLSIALGLKAIEAGYSVCFERITTLIKLLKTMEIQRSSAFRINKIMKSSLLIIDEIGYTPIDRKEANLFFNLISEMYERSSVIITSNKGFDQWSEMMGDKIMTTAMLDRLLHHAHVFSLDGDSYRIQQKMEV